jgi:uncharacterized protein YqhQ
MIIISILFSTLVQFIFPGVYEIPWLWIIVKILLVPIICGVGFEVLRACGKYDNILTRIISAPGLWMQRITTKEPDEYQLAIAICAIIINCSGFMMALTALRPAIHGRQDGFLFPVLCAMDGV